MAIIAVRGIVPGRKAAHLTIAGDLLLIHTEEGANNVISPDGHARQPGGSAAVEDPKQNGFDLVRRVVSGENPFRTLPHPGFLEPMVAPLPRRGLGGIRPEAKVCHDAAQPAFRGQTFDQCRGNSAVNRDPVIHMGDDQYQSVDRGALRQKIQQRHRIRAARYGDEGSLARLGPQCRQAGKKVGKHAVR